MMNKTNPCSPWYRYHYELCPTVSRWFHCSVCRRTSSVWHSSRSSTDVCKRHTTARNAVRKDFFMQRNPLIEITYHDRHFCDVFVPFYPKLWLERQRGEEGASCPNFVFWSFGKVNVLTLELGPHTQLMMTWRADLWASGSEKCWPSAIKFKILEKQLKNKYNN